MTTQPDPSERDRAIQHCVATIQKVVQQASDDRRLILQLGYNLGRLSELTGQGREPFWDAWKEPVASGDHDAQARLASQLAARLGPGS